MILGSACGWTAVEADFVRLNKMVFEVILDAAGFIRALLLWYNLYAEPHLLGIIKGPVH